VKGDETQDPDFETVWWEGIVSSRPEASPWDATDSVGSRNIQRRSRARKVQSRGRQENIVLVVGGGDPERACRSEAGPEAMAAPSVTQFLPGREGKCGTLPESLNRGQADCGGMVSRWDEFERIALGARGSPVIGCRREPR